MPRKQVVSSLRESTAKISSWNSPPDRENLTGAHVTRTNQTDVLNKRKLIDFTERISYL
jgi:hypothetical protein